ncbi:MAG TPA: energy transducer TonB [Burkholderiales bacterium]|nr:energy transducer TonB [Burkholderiales bacterium]
MRTSPVHPTSRCCAVVATFVALLCAPPPAGAVSELISALGSSEPPFVPLSEEEAHHALERDLLLKVGKYLQVSDYPGEARRWRWTGTVLVEVLVAADGMVKQVALSRTSGFRVLDMQALEVVRRVSKLFVPVGLRQRDRTVTVPVSFHLQKS